MAAVDAALPSGIQTLVGVVWSIIGIAGMVVLLIRYWGAARSFYRLFDWIKENWVTGVETPPPSMQLTMLGLVFRSQPTDPELEQFRQKALRRLMFVPIWLVGWGALFVAGTVFLSATGLTR